MDTPRQPGPRRTPPYFAAVGLVAVSLAVVGTLLTAPPTPANDHADCATDRRVVRRRLTGTEHPPCPAPHSTAVDSSSPR